MVRSLYIHIPFCIRKCAYCDFLSVTFDDVTAGAYIRALSRELELRKASAGPLRTVYIGGGTPSVLTESMFEALFRCLRDNFDLLPDCEITVEANPGTLDTVKSKALLSLGVNRLSIGVQSFDDGELRTLGRIHSSCQAADAIAAARKAGFNNISVDLIYGIPGQTPETWSRTLALAISLAPVHISAYELSLEEDTPLVSHVRSGALVMPDEDLVLEMYDYAINRLSASGHEHYEVSNFALPGLRSVHNLNYWDRGEYIGAGAGSHSFLCGVRSRNTADISGYIRDLGHSLLPQSESEVVSKEEALREFLFLGLRKREGLSSKICLQQGMDIPGKAQELFDLGYLDSRGDVIRLTRRGLCVSNTVMVRLFEQMGL